MTTLKTPPCAAYDADTEQEFLREDLEAKEADKLIQEEIKGDIKQ